MNTSTISASSWYQGTYDASTDTYNDSVYYISTSKIVIPFGSQTLKFSGEGSQVVLVNRWVGATVEGQRIAYIDNSSYQSDAIRISYKILDSSGTQLTNGTMSYSGGTRDISAYPQAKYIVISLNIETSSYSYPIIKPGEDTEIKRMIVEDGRSRVYELDNAPQFELDHYVWHEVGDGPHSDDAPVYPEDIEPPWPDGVWRIESGYNNGFPFNRLMPNIPIAKGAFENASALAAVRVPISVKTIGATAFKGTALQRVKIAADCAYEETSFPAGCVVEHYDDDRYEQLRDCEGRAILDCDARRIYVRKAENTNG